MPDCGEVPPAVQSNLPEMITRWSSGEPTPETNITPYIYKNCTLRLDSFAKLYEHELHYEVHDKSGRPIVALIARSIFENVLVIYSGRNLPSNAIEFKRCVFAIDLNQPVQDPKTRNLIFSLLTSDTSNITTPQSA